MELKNYPGTFIVAELSANHNGSLQVAKETIRAAKEAGADAVKIQTYTADTITIDCDNEYFKIKSGTIWDGRTLYNLYQEAYTPWEWHKELQEVAKEEGLLFFSTPFDKAAVDFLEELSVPVYKIASFEITDIPLIEYAAVKAKPMIISTGIATMSEIDEAVKACHRQGNYDVTLLKCTSSYPAPVEEINLLTMVNMRETFNVEIGLSDHTLGASVALAAVAMGAKVIEKHFIIDREIGGPDSSFSMEPHDFRQMVSGIRDIEKALGRVTYDLSQQSIENRVFSRSLFVVKDVERGDLVTEVNVRSIRPGYGMAPKHLPKIIGKQFRASFTKGTPLSQDMVGDPDMADSQDKL